MTHTIYIDKREGEEDRNLIKFVIQDTITREKEARDYVFEEKVLPIGDMVCGDIVIERKDHRRGDFISSMIGKDGRLESQCYDITQFNHRFVIVIGDPYRFDNNMSVNSIIGMIAKLNIDYGIHTITVPTTHDYAYMAYKLIDRLIHPRPLQTPTFFGERRKLTKRETYINMIGQIQGVGQERATTIVDDFGIKKVEDFRYINIHNYTALKSEGKLKGIGKKVFDAITQ